MRYGLKERLIGALALIALAVIFLPLLLEEGRVPPPVSDKIEMPPKPEPVRAQVEAAQKPSLAPVLNEQEKALVEQQRQQPQARGVSSAMQLSLEGGVEAWAIQVASFGEQANARRLVERLQKQDFHAYWRLINNMAVVFTGPYIDQEQARRHQDQLLQQEGLRTLLTRYVPEHQAREQGSLPNLSD